MDKSSISKICVDDFAIRKRYTYGTVMIDLETHRVVDIMNSRETEKVAEWLKTYPNIQVISRDGASTYANASSLSHPEAYQISDRFHLFKNLSEAFSRFLMRQFPARIEIPSNKGAATIEMAALYETRNLSQRIRFAKQKRKEGYTISEIALCMHLGETTKIYKVARRQNPTR
ncbi:Transposase [[Clostridium] polysaccharolyticum]|uniref:Transposase n=1 Tax=[Clostridium] polysaccharolyticum TaxID=29364 RepID=A0A1I0G578_9FIRM|nr:Transposase [[Clostridium] polysaccharolyticum]